MQAPGFGGFRLGWAGASGAGARAHEGLGPGFQGLAACDQFFVVLKSPGRGLAKGWESAE